jgi:hypothetical protein
MDNQSSKINLDFLSYFIINRLALTNPITFSDAQHMIFLILQLFF